MKGMRKLEKILVKAGAVGGVAAVCWAIFKNTNVTYNFWGPENLKEWDFNWDRRDPECMISPKAKQTALLHSGEDNQYHTLIDKCKARAVRHLFLIRHGQYNLAGKCDAERVLTNLGVTQARYTGERLNDLGFPFSIIIQSSMTRAQQTAAEISKSLPLPVKTCSLLCEGAPFPAIPEQKHWHPLSQVHQDSARIEAAFRKYFHRADPSQKADSYEIIVAHANVIRYFVCRALQFPPEGWLRMSLHHASITWISILPNGKVTLKCLGDSGHLPTEKMTTS